MFNFNLPIQLYQFTFTLTVYKSICCFTFTPTFGIFQTYIFNMVGKKQHVTLVLIYISLITESQQVFIMITWIFLLKFLFIFYISWFLPFLLIHRIFTIFYTLIRFSAFLILSQQPLITTLFFHFNVAVFINLFLYGFLCLCLVIRILISP